MRAKHCGAEVSVINMQHLLYDTSHGADVHERYQNVQLRIADNLAETKPDIVGLSIKWDMLNAAAFLAKQVKERLPETLVVSGNSLAAFGGKELLALQEFKGTLAVAGEGEDALLRIIETAQSQTGPINDPSLYRSIPNVRSGLLSKVSFAALDLAQYPALTEDTAPELFNVGRGGEAPLEFSRGCGWHKCGYCSIPALYRTPEWRPFALSWMLDMIERFMVARGVFSFYSIDSEFFGGMEEDFEASMKRANDLAEGLIRLQERHSEGRFKITKFSARVDSVFKKGERQKNRIRKEIYQLLQRAGFRKVYLGLESGSAGQLERFHKGVSVADNRGAPRVLRKIGMSYEPGFIFFDPDLSREEGREDLGFIERTKLYNRGARLFGALRLQAGSPLAGHYINQGLADPRMDLNTVSYRVLRYRDPQVAKTQEIFQAWERQTRELIKYLHHLVGRKNWYGRIVTNRPWRNRISKLDFVLMKRLFNNDPEKYKAIALAQADRLAATIMWWLPPTSRSRLASGPGSAPIPLMGVATSV